MSERTEEFLDWVLRLSPVVLAGVLAWLTVKADTRYLQQDTYYRDQTKIEKRLDEIGQDIKTLLREH